VTPTRLSAVGSAARPGSNHDLTAAREPVLYRRAARGLPILADKGYSDAGVGVQTPVKRLFVVPGE
jgi:hypothetical protein